MAPPGPNATVLVVEDEPDVRRLLQRGLEQAGYGVLAAASAEEALALARRNRPILALIDIMLPRLDGWELLRRLRQGSDIPVIFLSALRSESDRVAGIRLGADDYVGKPFSMAEVAARVGAVLRRGREPRGNGVLRRGALEVDVERCSARLAGRLLVLSPKEFELLAVLAKADGKVLSREELLEKVWGVARDIRLTTRTVDQHAARLRRKLRGESKRLRSVRGRGYALIGDG